MKIYYDENYFDCYAIYIGHKNKINGLTECLGLSKNPDSPLGFSQWCQGQPGKHNGSRITIEDLPDNVRKHALARLNDA